MFLALVDQLPEDEQGASKPRERRLRSSVWAWAGAVALLLFAVYSIRETRRFERELAALQNQLGVERRGREALESDREFYSQVLTILSAPSTRELTLRPAQTSLPEVRAYWNQQLGLVLAGHRIPAPAPDRTFQLWVVPKKGNPISAGIFRPDVHGRLMYVSKPEAEITTAAALAITDEPAGGRPQPTVKPLWVGSLS